MRAIFKNDVVVFVPETPAESARVSAYVSSHVGHVYELRSIETGVTLRDLGPKPEACREPINIGSRISNEAWRPISNFAATPFSLDGESYGSVEAFWQSLKFERPDDRRRIAGRHGLEAKKSAAGISNPEFVTYGGCSIRYAGPDHWALMRRACDAKFSQDRKAHDALLATGTRPLEHRMRRDSRSIPGVVMSRIWMDVRAALAER